MNLDKLIARFPDVKTYFEYMPPELHNRYTIRTYAPGTIIHQKDYPLNYFGIVCSGDHRVINEFENGNVFMIEKTKPSTLSARLRSLLAKKKPPSPLKR